MMRRADFDAAAATIQRETAGEWMLEPSEIIAGRVSMASVMYRGVYITAFKCYGQQSGQLYAVVVQLVKACYLFESAGYARAAA